MNGDFLVALARAREIETSVLETDRSGTGRLRLSFSEFLDLYRGHLNQRADAGEIDVRTVNRYRAALDYLRRFAAQPEIFAAYSHPARADRQFVLQFQTFLQQQRVQRGQQTRPLTGLTFILAAARSAYAWGIDPEEGRLFTSTLVNPFRGRNWSVRRPAADPTQELPITVAMAVEWLQACDDYQRRLFTPLILFGLRATEIA